MGSFVGRKEEIKTLLSSFSNKKGTLNIIKGRRRIGKSTLIKELKNRDSRVKLRYLTSLPPKPETKDEEERRAYADQIQREFSLPYLPPHDSWKTILYFAVGQCVEPYTILAIDEVNWLARKSDIALEQILFEVWERECANKANFMLILSGSLASWMQENIILNEGFVGRITVDLTLRELALNHIREFFGKQKSKLPNSDIIKLLCAFGGVPLYLEFVDPNLTAETNLINQAYKNTGPLNDEFNKMFSELFSDDNKVYRNILEVIGTSEVALTVTEIAKKIDKHYTGRMNKAIKGLTDVGFIKKQTAWDIKTARSKQNHRYKIADNYTAFFFRSINKQNVIKEHTKTVQVPANLASILGLQFENLVENNVNYILNELQVKHPIFVGSYFQTKTQRQDGCQIDLLIQTKQRLYICECKMLGKKIPKAIINEVDQKIKRLKKNSNIQVCPVLIHVNGVMDSVIQEDYFSHIINMSDSLRA